MSSTKVQVFEEVVAPEEVQSPVEVQKKAKHFLRGFFPPGVIVSLIALAWLFVFLPVMVLVTSSFMGGIISALALVSYTWIGLLVFDTYSPPERTIIIAMVASVILGLAVLSWFSDSGYASLFVVLPVLIFVTLRVNMNGRKALILFRAFKERKVKD